MAVCQSVTRSNYFHVRDEEMFLDFISRVSVDDGDIELLLDTDPWGEPLFAFVAAGSIIGICDDTDETAFDDDAYGNFISGLQEIVASNDAIIIMEISLTDSKSVGASSTIITANDTDYIDLQELSSDKAIDMLMEQHNYPYSGEAID